MLKGPKTYPCKFFHGYKGCIWGETCSFIHEESYKGMRIPYIEMESVIANHQVLYK
jgi:hypothetical protein